MNINDTRKTQEIAEAKKSLPTKQEQPAGDETEEVKKFLDSAGYVRKEQLEEYVASLSQSQQDEETIKTIIASNPELKQFEWAIRTIAKTDDSAIEDIVVKYWFSTHDKLTKAKQSRGIVGNSNIASWEKSKSVAEMTTQERDKVKAGIVKKWDFR